MLATQRPSIGSSPASSSRTYRRICFKVSSKIDSRVVLDEMGADKLLGKGDLLFLQPGAAGLIRCQRPYASDKEIHKVVDCLECEPSYEPELMHLNTTSREG